MSTPPPSKHAAAGPLPPKHAAVYVFELPHGGSCTMDLHAQQAGLGDLAYALVVQLDWDGYPRPVYVMSALDLKNSLAVASQSPMRLTFTVFNIGDEPVHVLPLALVHCDGVRRSVAPTSSEVCQLEPPPPTRRRVLAMDFNPNTGSIQ